MPITTRFDHLTTREQFIAVAAENSLDLEADDFDGTEETGLYLQGLPAAHWLDAMTMD